MLTKTDHDDSLYRYLPFYRFTELLFESTLAASSPTQWDDKYETYWLASLKKPAGQKRLEEHIKAKTKEKNQERVQKSVDSIIQFIYKNIFCICFSQTGDQELMWRANSDSNRSVMICTSKEKVSQLGNETDVLKNIQYDLDDYKNLDNFLEKITINDTSSMIWDVDDLFLHKRNCFQYEDEVRFLHKTVNASGESPKIVKLDVDVADFVLGVMAHPAADDNHIKLVESMCKHFGLEFLGKSRIYEICD